MEDIVLPLKTDTRPAYSPGKGLSEDPFEIGSSSSSFEMIGKVFGAKRETGRKRETKPQKRKRKEYNHGNGVDMYYSERYRQSICIDSRLKTVLDFKDFEFFSNRSVLDIGCGCGFISFYIAAYLGASRVVGQDIDFDSIMLNLKQLRKFKHEGIRVGTYDKQDFPAICVRRTGTVRPTNKYWRIENSYVSANASKFPFNIEFMAGEVPREKFDIVLCLKVFQYVSDQEAFASRIASCVEPGGYLIVESVKVWGKIEEYNFSLIKRFKSLIIFQKNS
jgi:2-polyprenyl-3-methyl-5-hydroxy-6-metoxy-1,4-benzoquinol methylase